jgi:hypothetical protein
MRNRLKPLPQLVLTDLQPSFYDVVSVSTDQMVAKFYAYLQQWVDDYNNYINDINAIIDEFTRCSDMKYEEFTNCVKDLMTNYIESVDTKIALQDSKIADAIEYMKNNLVNTINNLFAEALENGNIVATLGATYDEPTETLTLYIEGDENNG